MPIEKWSDRVVIVHMAVEPQFSDDLQNLEEQLPIDAILDLAGVRFVNSSHIARLLTFRKAANAAGSKLIICGVDPQIWSTFLVTGLDKVFDFRENVPTALASL